MRESQMTLHLLLTNQHCQANWMAGHAIYPVNSALYSEGRFEGSGPRAFSKRETRRVQSSHPPTIFHPGEIQRSICKRTRHADILSSGIRQTSQKTKQFSASSSSSKSSCHPSKDTV